MGSLTTRHLFLLIGSRTLIICKSEAFSLEPHDVLDVLHLALEEGSTLSKIIRIVVGRCHLLIDYANAGNYEHLVGGKDCLEALGKRAEIQEEVVLDVEALNGRLRLGRCASLIIVHLG